MSTLSNISRNILSLIFPPICMGCGSQMRGRSEWVCQQCRATMPTTGFHLMEENDMVMKLRSFAPSIYHAASQFYYVKGGVWRNVIHSMKYKRSWLTAYRMGFWYGSELIESPKYQDIDFIVPIPLHPSRRLKRRYNQSEMVAEGMAAAMKTKLSRSALRRLRNNPSQVTQRSDERWANVAQLFSLPHPERLAGRNILLVDDVFTTGATMVSAIETIVAAAPTCRISVATLGARKFF